MFGLQLLPLLLRSVFATPYTYELDPSWKPTVPAALHSIAAPTSIVFLQSQHEYASNHGIAVAARDKAAGVVVVLSSSGDFVRSLTLPSDIVDLAYTGGTHSPASRQSLWSAHSASSRIIETDPTTGALLSSIGGPGSAGKGAATPNFGALAGMTVDAAAQNIFVADGVDGKGANHRISKLTRRNGTESVGWDTTWVAGQPNPSLPDLGKVPITAPSSIALDPLWGDLHVNDVVSVNESAGGALSPGWPVTRWLTGSSEGRIPGGSMFNRQFEMACLFPWFTGDPTLLKVHSIRIAAHYKHQSAAGVYESRTYVGVGDANVTKPASERLNGVIAVIDTTRGHAPPPVRGGGRGAMGALRVGAAKPPPESTVICDHILNESSCLAAPKWPSVSTTGCCWAERSNVTTGKHCRNCGEDPFCNVFTYIDTGKSLNLDIALDVVNDLVYVAGGATGEGVATVERYRSKYS